MDVTENHETLISLVAELKEEATLELVWQYMAAGGAPLEIIDICHRGMVRVGKKYEKETYFISGLMWQG